MNIREMFEEETKKKMILISSILYKNNVPIEEGKIIGHFIEELVKENEKLNHYKLLYQKVKERNDKAIEFIENNGEKQYNHHDNYRGKWYRPEELDTLDDILKGENEE